MAKDNKQEELKDRLWELHYRLMNSDAITRTDTRTALKELLNALLGYESDEDDPLKRKF